MYRVAEVYVITSGGLGNVAGDQLKAAGDLGVPPVLRRQLRAAGLAHDLPRWDRDELLDTLWSLVSPELHELVVTERHWTAAHYQRWLGQTLSAVILSR